MNDKIDNILTLIKAAEPSLFDKNGAFNLNKFQQLVKEENTEFSQEGYGLSWMGKSYARALAYDREKTLFAPNLEHNQQPINQTSQNLLIKGDNLAVLKHLKTAYRNQVKMIYIDPPYNTGSDGFVYNDSRKYSVEQISEITGESIEEAARIQSFITSKSSTHSAWLTFMYPRLKVARELLKEDGVIFISIDDNEAAQLKLLCDEIFGEGNFVADVIWERAYSPVNLKKHFSESHDYLLCYGKNIELLINNGLKRTEEANNRYSNPDNDSRGVWGSDNLSVGPAIQENIYEIITPTGRKVLPPSGRSWSLSKERFQEFINENRIWFGETGNNVPRIKRFLSEVKQGITPMTIWKYQEVGHSQSASQDLKKLFDGKSFFTYPKPINLIGRCLDLYVKNNDLILDFFAGSGTTAHAVMQQNAEDSKNGQAGNRKYICVQIDEPTDVKSEAHKAGYLTIYDITKARIEKAAAKIRNDFPDFQGDLGFKEYFVQPLPEHFDVEAQNAEQGDLLAKNLQLSEDDCRNLLYTWAIHDGMKPTEEPQEVDLSGYKAWQYAENLYLLNQDFSIESLTALLRRLDDIEDYFNISRIVVLEHQLNSAALRELNEAVAQYLPKKGNRLNLQIRYGVED